MNNKIAQFIINATTTGYHEQQLLLYIIAELFISCEIYLSLIYSSWRPLDGQLEKQKIRTSKRCIRQTAVLSLPENMQRTINRKDQKKVVLFIFFLNTFILILKGSIKILIPICFIAPKLMSNTKRNGPTKCKSIHSYTFFLHFCKNLKVHKNYVIGRVEGGGSVWY